MDHDVARLDIVVCVLKDADLPVSIRRNHFGTAPLSNFQPFGNRRTIHRHQFLVERTPRLLEDPWNYGPQPIQIVTVQIYIVDGWGQGGILQWLQPLPHVAHNFKDDFTRGSRVGSRGAVHRSNLFSILPMSYSEAPEPSLKHVTWEML